MEPEHPPFEQEVTSEPNQSVWNTVTPVSKYLAMALFVLLPFVGGYVGYQFAPEKVVEVEKIVVNEVPAENVNAGFSSGSPAASATVPNYCVRVNPRENYSLYTNVRNQLISKYPDLDLERMVRDGQECLLANGDYLALMPFENTSDSRNPFWGHFIVQYDKDASINNISKPLKTASGEMFVSEMTPQYTNHIRFILNAGDPCYSAYYVYTYNLESEEITEEMYGGEDMECWERFRQSGAPY